MVLVTYGDGVRIPSDADYPEMSSDSLDRNHFAHSDDLEDRPQEVQSPASVSVKSEADSDTGVIKRDICVNRTWTWHEHVYRKLNSKPTPHYIENILGLQTKPSSDPQDLKSRMIAETPVAQDSLPKITPSVPELNEPLNLSIRSDLKVRSKTMKGGFCSFHNDQIYNFIPFIF